MNTTIYRDDSLFNCEIHNLRKLSEGGQAALVLEKPCEGSVTTPVYKLESPANDLVPSWNTRTPEGSHAEIFVRLLIEGRWSKWFSYGKWSTLIERRCPDDEDRLAWSNSWRDGGDSSINVKDGKLAEAFQLKAVLRAHPNAKEMPSIRLLAATWKNTDDPDWHSKLSYPEEKVEEKKRVLLDTPAISQMRRDPAYGGVICSAVTITVLMNTYGRDFLPEEVTYAGLDYAFVGNGNWSYSCACAGAYGFESFCVYTDFEGLRQELSKGHPVGLSVKYSLRHDSDVPFLENATGTTHGHLIACIGYYFNEELGEFVYYCNDSAGSFDLSAGPREYKESDLSKAWYRRMTYFCRDKNLPGGDAHAFRRMEAKLAEIPGNPGVYSLEAGGNRIALPRDFQDRRYGSFDGRGTIYWYDDEEHTPLGEGRRRVTANRVFHYEGVIITDDGNIKIQSDLWNLLLAQGRKIVVGIVDSAGYHYIVKL